MVAGRRAVAAAGLGLYRPRPVWHQAAAADEGKLSELEDLGLEGPSWWVPPSQAGGGAGILEQSRRLKREGIIAKRLSSTYTPGVRTGAWLKIKNQARQELVIVGSTPGEGARAGHVGALLVAYYDRRGPGGRLVYAGRVGTGFTASTLQMLRQRLAPLRRETAPLEVGRPPKDVEYIEPDLVCEVEFTEWTRDGTLRHPSFKGLRDDKKPRDVVREV